MTSRTCVIGQRRRCSLAMQADDLLSCTMVVAAANHPDLFDRAVSQSFQSHLTPPLPWGLTVGFERLAVSERFDVPQRLPAGKRNQLNRSWSDRDPSIACGRANIGCAPCPLPGSTAS